MPIAGSFIVHTRQLWKFITLGLWSAGFAWFMFNNLSRRSANVGVDLLEELAGVVIGVLGMLYIGLSVCCPRCRGRILLYCLRTFPVTEIAKELKIMRECPICRYSPSPRV